MEYDPRRLFPFGLSPIPEVPSELASEVSSMYSYNDDDEESEADTEVEGAKTPGSIMYSGSCSSVKSNGTLEDKIQAADSSSEDSGREDESEDEDTEDTDEEEDRIIIEASMPIDKTDIVLSENLPDVIQQQVNTISNHETEGKNLIEKNCFLVQQETSARVIDSIEIIEA